MKKDTPTDIGLLLVRLGLGLVMVHAGAGKLFGFDGGPGSEMFIAGMAKSGVPAIAAWCAIVAEFFGGLGVLFGLLTRIAAGGIALTMRYATFTKLQPIIAGTAEQGKAFNDVMGPGIYLLLAIAVVCMGPGRASFDAALFTKKPRK